VTEFREQTLEPVKESGGLDSHAYRSVKIAVERLGLAALVIQAPLEKQLSGGFFRHGNLLIACMKIATYNQHCSAPFPEPWSFNSNQVYSVEGADAVIQSGSRHISCCVGCFVWRAVSGVGITGSGTGIFSFLNTLDTKGPQVVCQSLERVRQINPCAMRKRKGVCAVKGGMYRVSAGEESSDAGPWEKQAGGECTTSGVVVGERLHKTSWKWWGGERQLPERTGESRA